MGLKDYSEQSFEEMAANEASQEETPTTEEKEVESTEESSDGV